MIHYYYIIRTNNTSAIYNIITSALQEFKGFFVCTRYIQ